HGITCAPGAELTVPDWTPGADAGVYIAPTLSGSLPMSVEWVENTFAFPRTDAIGGTIVQPNNFIEYEANLLCRVTNAYGQTWARIKRTLWRRMKTARKLKVTATDWRKARTGQAKRRASVTRCAPALQKGFAA